MKVITPIISCFYVGLVFMSCGVDRTGVIVEPTSQTLFATPTDTSVACYRIPAIVTATNGDLIAAIDERIPSCGDLKWSRDINIVMRRSMDHGATWTAIESIVDLPDGESASDPSMIVDEETEEIFLFYNYMNHDVAKDVYYLHMVKSADHGASWSEPIDITDQITKPAWHGDFKFITSGRGIQTRGRKLLHCLVNLESGMHVFGSDDHGETWYLIDTPIMPADESKIMELDNGDWMINSRVQKAGLRYVHTSKDEGKTWLSKPDSTLIDPSCNASIIRVSSISQGDKKNRILFANAASTTERAQLTVRLSYDEGQTWPYLKVINLGSSAYASMTLMDNGDIGLFYEKDNYTMNDFTSFSLNWLTGGADHGE